MPKFSGRLKKQQCFASFFVKTPRIDRFKACGALLQDYGTLANLALSLTEAKCLTQEDYCKENKTQSIKNHFVFLNNFLQPE